MSDLITVVIPTFNNAWSIDWTLQSVKEQTHQNFECIIVDDGSTDDLDRVTASYLETDPRFRVVRQNNAGLAAARNRGLKEAQTELVAFIDSDDVWHPDFLKDVSEALATDPEAPFAYAHSFRITEDNFLIPGPKWTRKPRHDFAGLLTLNSVGNGSATIFRADRIKAVGGFDPSLRARKAEGAEDWKLLLRLAHQNTPVMLQRYLVGYRLAVQSMSQSNPDRQLRAIRTVMEDIKEEFPGTPNGDFRQARTMMNGWLLPAFLRKRMYRKAAKLFAEAYLGNPLWFRSADLRTIHVHKMKEIAAQMQKKGSDLLHISQLTENGAHPFSMFASRESSKNLSVV